MRPRIVRSSEDVHQFPIGQASGGIAALHAVDGAGAPVMAPELWVGLHIVAFKSVESFRKDLLLERLATQAQRFTPRVSLVPPDGMLLEVKGSLHLFNGAEGLIEALLGECHTLEIESMVALAPTPLAALVAARAGELVGAGSSGCTGSPSRVGSGHAVRALVVTNKAQLMGSLSPIPLVTLRWPPHMLEQLARMGLRTIGQVLRLPRAGFARRFGSEYLAELDRLTGRAADLRHHFQPRERFRRRRELTYELESAATLLAVLEPLLTQLGQFLLERQCGITEIECWLRHRHAPTTVCQMRLTEPLADVGQLTQLLGERLNALELPEPVRSCEIRSGFPVRRVLLSHSLWRPGEHGSSADAQAPELIERLRARLGHESVYGLQVLQGHRPEDSWSRREPSARRGSLPELPWPVFRRPLWLLQVPQQLDEVDGVPWRRGGLRLCGGPERIETGWWDGRDVGRDYYIALDIYGVRLWVFRERAAPHRWFLHGVFG